MGIDKRKKYYLILDIETANICDDAIAYDIGFAVADKKGRIYDSYSFCVKEMFYYYQDLLATAYYSEKLPQYFEDIKNGTRELQSIYYIRKKVHEVMKLYNTKDVFAYNCYFDKNGLNRTMRYLTKSFCRWFFPYGTQFHCIWHMACQVLFTQKSFQKMANEQNWKSTSGNFQTSAEIAYRYIHQEYDFLESHTGLEDVLIECEIMAKCFRQHKKMNTSINRLCWQIPQQKNKKIKKNY